jgi:hypothetical protein
MRPISFTFLPEPEKITPPEEGFYLWRYTLICDDGTKVLSEIRIYKTAVDLAQNDPDHCEPDVAKAVETNGRSVIQDNVLKRDDPPLRWVVHVNVILADITA